MPHVVVKLWPGKSEQQKERLAEKIAKDVMDSLNYGEESVSVPSLNEHRGWLILGVTVGVAIRSDIPA
jgi:hypothetical protein